MAETDPFFQVNFDFDQSLIEIKLRSWLKWIKLILSDTKGK